MNDEGKKIAFSFSKVKKPALINKVNLETTEKKEYVDCFDGSKGQFSYKGTVRNDDKQKPELIIPMPTSKTSLDIVRSRIEEKYGQKAEQNGQNKQEKIGNNGDVNVEETESKNLDSLAALEIIREAKSDSLENQTAKNLVIESKDELTEASEADIDYDNVPVSDFGLALLKGMGWKPGAGIGKEPRIVEASSPKLRPKGLGLGATIVSEPNEKSEKNERKEKREKYDDESERREDRRDKEERSYSKEDKRDREYKSERRDDRRDDRRYDRDDRRDKRGDRNDRRDDKSHRRDDRRDRRDERSDKCDDRKEHRSSSYSHKSKRRDR